MCIAGAPTNVFQVMTRAVSAAQKHQLEVWERHADLVLRPDVQALAWDDFDRAEEAIEAGAAVAQRALPRIQKYLDQLKTFMPAGTPESLGGTGTSRISALSPMANSSRVRTSRAWSKDDAWILAEAVR